MSRSPFLKVALTGAASVALLSACASVPDLGPAPTAKLASSYAARDSFAAPAADWPQDAWWTAYGDPQLSALIDEALKGAPAMAAAEARLRKAGALAQQAGAVLKPELKATGSAGAVAIAPPEMLGGGGPTEVQSNGYVLLQGGYDFDLWGRNRTALAAATSEAEAARADVAQARLVLSSSVAAAYADLVKLYADLDAANEALEVRRKTLELMSQRFDNGLENRGAVRQAETGKAQAEAELAALQEAVGLNRNRIAALVGAGPDRGLQIQRPTATTARAFGLPQQLQAELLGRRPDVIAARLRAEAAVSRTQSAKAAFYPNVNLSLLGAGAVLDLSDISGSALALGSIGPAISLPIFEGGRLEAQYRGARADHAGAIAEYDRTVVQAFQEVADVAVSERALSQRLDASRRAHAAAEAAHAIALDRYQGGLSSYLDVLRAEDQLIATRRSVADLETRAFALDVALVRALGGGFTPASPERGASSQRGNA